MNTYREWMYSVTNS